MNKNRIGIIGAGAIGQAFATQLVRAGLGARLSNSRGPASLVEVAKAIGPGIVASTVEEAAQSELVLLSVGWKHIPAAVAGIADWQGRIVIDASNPIIQPGFQVAELGGRGSSEVVAGLLPGARLVKAFNTLPSALLASNPRAQGGQRVLFYAGDDGAAKAEVAALIAQLGFAGIDLGSLAAGGRLQQFPGGPLAAKHLSLHA